MVRGAAGAATLARVYGRLAGGLPAPVRSLGAAARGAAVLAGALSVITSLACMVMYFFSLPLMTSVRRFLGGPPGSRPSSSCWAVLLLLPVAAEAGRLGAAGAVGGAGFFIAGTSAGSAERAEPAAALSRASSQSRCGRVGRVIVGGAWVEPE